MNRREFEARCRALVPDSPAKRRAEAEHARRTLAAIRVEIDRRGQNVGSTLIEAFRAICREHHLRGLHAVTAAGSRAAAFFTRCGLEERATADWRGRPLVLLAEPLDSVHLV